MAVDVVIPKLGMTMEKAKVGEWKAAEGDSVEAGQVILVIETEKVSYDIEARQAGLLHIIAAPGEEIPVGELVGQLAESEEELAQLQADKPAAAGKAAPVEAGKAETVAAVPAGRPAGRSGKIRISPRARKRAAAHNLDVSNLAGSGPGGRIIQKDVEAAIAAGVTAPARDTWSGEVLNGKRVKESIPLKGMRQVISEHMMHSLQSSAQLSAGTEVDMTEMIRFRESQRKRETYQGLRLSYTDIFVYIVARVLREQPIMNASLIDGEIKLWEDINLGVAVALDLGGGENGLVVPVIRNADTLSLVETSQAMLEITRKAREGKLGPDDMTGGTFTLTNTGTFGRRWSWATPVINQPESAILMTGATVDRAVPVNQEIVVRPVMSLGITFDHRLVDGMAASRFMFRIADLMEDPYRLIQ